jgi:hypothetical protein
MRKGDVLMHRNYAKRVVVLGVILSSMFPVFGFGESILVSTHYPGAKLFGKEVATLCESGIMDRLFGAGHLVFSTEVNEVAYHQDFEASSVRIAKNCGAQYLLEVRIDFATTVADVNDPEKAVYRLYDVAGDHELSEGSFPFSESDEESLETAGAGLASVVLERL